MAPLVAPGRPALSVRDAYALWAPTYADGPENPLLRMERTALVALLPELAGRRVLDLACGSGRHLERLGAAGARQVVGLDLTQAMLARARRVPARLVQGDMTSLPLAPAAFDVVVCSLAVGHVPDLEGALREMARVVVPHGFVVYSDMHPAGAARGWRRTFRAADGRLHEAPHHAHARTAHETACAASGLRVEQVGEPVVDFDHPDRGVPAVLVVRARRLEGADERGPR